MRFLLPFALFLSATASAAPADVVAPGTPGIVSHERLVQDWWQWLRGTGNAPANDTTGAACAQGQSGPVWHLAGTLWSERMKRVCKIPAGKYVFFPVVTVAYNPDVPGGISCEGARARITPLADKAVGLHAELDGSPLPAVRVRSAQCFDMFARQTGKRKDNGFPTAADGYWVLLKPLARGRHKLKFGGSYEWPTGVYPDAKQDIEYELRVD